MKSGQKSVLCFGDSHTWGYIPLHGGRYEHDMRWTTLLENQLPGNWRVINEGLPGRTTGFHESLHNPHSGLGYFLPCLEKHQPDVVVIMLGTNDLQSQFGLTAHDIASGAGELVKYAQYFANHNPTKARAILLVCPTPIDEIGFAAHGFTGAKEKSHQFDDHYHTKAEELGCYYFNAGSIVKACASEGVHWPADQLPLFADALYQRIRTIIA